MHVSLSSNGECGRRVPGAIFAQDAGMLATWTCGVVAQRRSAASRACASGGRGGNTPADVRSLRPVPNDPVGEARARRAPGTNRETTHAMTRPPALNPARPAVFVVDMLHDCFVHAQLQRLRPSLCASINALTAMARAAGHPVIWVRQEFEPDLSDAMPDMKRDDIRMFIRGTAGPRVLDELDRADTDLELVKKRFSMFFRTGLDALLQQLGTDQVVLAGVNTHACIRTAAIDAYQRDLEVAIVRECVASKDAHHHDVTLDYLDGGVARVVSLAELGQQFRAGHTG
jgi:nicotinamidase-related amidase